MLYIFLFLLIFCVVLYAILIIADTIGWIRLPEYDVVQKNDCVTVIIPARNEAQNIEKLLQKIVEQSFPKEQLEIIIADDHSTDATIALTESFKQQHSDLCLSIISVVGEGKKSALSEAIQLAHHDWIITTDADCIPVSSHWINTMVACFSETTQLVSAPVVFLKGKGLFQKMQSLEFLTLIASAAGAIGVKMPFMCNGANIAFRKSAFMETHGFENDSRASGDDVFLMERILQRFGADAIRFAKSKTAIVETVPMPNLSMFLQQRIRWAGKSVGYKNPMAIFASYVVFFNAFAILLSLFLGLFNTIFFWMSLVFFIVKIVVDIPICIMISKFTERLSLMNIFLPLQIVYPFYICYTAIASQLIKPTWKGRRLNK